MQYGGTTGQHIPPGEKKITSSFQCCSFALFTLLTFILVLPAHKAYSDSTQQSQQKQPGPQIWAYAQSAVGSAATANTCEVFAEQALAAAGDTIPKQEGASQAWDWFQQNWQQYAPCAPQTWDSTKASAGDLVFWSGSQAGSTCDKTWGHVAVYDGNGGIIENAGRGITHDHPVTYPCSTNPTGFVPMTSCNGPSSSPAGTYVAGGNTYSSFPQQNASQMSSLLPMMMMSSMMMPMMSSMMSAMSSLGANGKASSAAGNTTNASTGLTSGTTASSALTAASTGGTTSGTGTTASSAGATADAAATTGTPSSLSSLLTLLQNLLNNSGTASGSSTTPQVSSSDAAQDVQQLDQQSADETATATPIIPAAAVVAPVDPTQDYHAAGHADRRLSCGYGSGAGVANCRSAAGVSQ